MSEINAEFGLGNNLGVYRGQNYKVGTTISSFSSTNLGFDEFYGKSKLHTISYVGRGVSNKTSVFTHSITPSTYGGQNGDFFILAHYRRDNDYENTSSIQQWGGGSASRFIYNNYTHSSGAYTVFSVHYGFITSATTPIYMNFSSPGGLTINTSGNTGYYFDAECLMILLFRHSDGPVTTLSNLVPTLYGSGTSLSTTDPGAITISASTREAPVVVFGAGVVRNGTPTFTTNSPALTTFAGTDTLFGYQIYNTTRSNHTLDSSDGAVSGVFGMTLTALP